MKSVLTENRSRIEELVYRYAMASDGKDFNAVRECFSEDGVMIVRLPSRDDETIEGAHTIATWVEQQREALGMDVIKRHITSCFILHSCDGFSAFSTAYFSVFHAGESVPLHVAAVGHYEDTFRFTHGGWRFQKRLITVEARSV